MRPHGPAPVGDEAQFRVLAEMIPQLVWRSLNDGRWDWAGPQWVAFTGQAEGESHGLGWQDVVHPDDRERTARHWHAALGQSGFDVEHRLRRVDGAYRWFQTRAVPLRDRGGGITHWFGTSTDVDDLRQAEQRALFLAHHDSLTGAASRIGLEHALARMALAEAPHCLLCLDLDGFKSFNDQHGHAGGDALLRQVADRLRGCLTHADLLARVGGDEFVVVRCEARGYGSLARAIAAALATPLMVAGQTASVRTSIGIACSPHDGTVAEDLLRRADLALYRAKASGGGCALRFTRDMEDEVRERRALERDLAEALERGQIGVQFQPLFDLGGGGLRGFEALARWTHPERGVVAPARFIAAAERTGLVMPLGAAVLDLACSAAASWGEGVRVAVNLSPVQVYRADVPRLVADALARSGLAAQRLELEVTEGLLLEDGPLVQATLSALRGMGVRLVLDDFGTGYSSLSYLCRFRFDAVKVDRSFVAAMEGDAASQAVVTAVAALGRSLGMQVTAEGVETERQLALVRAAGCDLVQGFLLGRPVNREAATIMVRKASGPSDPPD